uniref:Putative scarecrow-like protein 9 n=1 Tax=Davidia involucrata TaxID=16924 RepID=A0A5B6Z9U1_DAVIN
MDSLIRGFSGCKNGFKYDQVSIPSYSDQNDLPFIPSGPSSPSRSMVEDSAEENVFSVAVLNYIQQMLMEDDLEGKAYKIQDSALYAAEKSFYDILHEKYPSTPNQPFPYQNINCSDDFVTHSLSNSCVNANSLSESVFNCNLHMYKSSHSQSPSVDLSCLSDSQSFCHLSSSSDTVVNMPPEIQSVLQFEGGMEEPREFRTLGNCEIFDLENNRLDPLGPKEKDERDLSTSLLWGRKNLHQEESYLEDGRRKKHLGVCIEESVLLELFSKVSLFIGGNGESAIYTLDEPLQNGASEELQQNVQSKGSNGGTNCTKKQVSRRKAVDMRTLLIQCAEAVAGNEFRSANELLKQIRWHSSPFGDKHRRLSHCFANSLEARLLGTGSPLYASLAAKNSADVENLKAHKLYISAFPFIKMLNFYATQMIVELANKASRLHVIHFGIFHGFQWLPLIHHLSKRPGGPPKLRITGVDHPEPGFRPAARVERTGRRLANYCERFNVPFEYNFIAQKWETICIEDLKIEKDEVLVVMSLHQFKYLPDDTISKNSPRDAVLNLIKKISPDIFIHGIHNGTYKSPFLVSRFREALFHFSALFDMFEANVPREDPDRMVYERGVYGKEVLNIIACEGSERIESPETYKQWQARNLRAGFRQLPLNQEIMKKVRAMVKLNYHKDFLVDDNNQWMLQGWKGRVIFALSCWKPA